MADIYNLSDYDYHRIIDRDSTANYIEQKYGNMMDNDDIYKLADFFVNKKLYKYEDIITGKYDVSIADHVRLYLQRKASVVKNEKEIENKVKLKTKKKKVMIALVTAGFLTLAGIGAYFGYQKIQEVNLKHEVSIDLARLSTGNPKTDGLVKNSIVGNHTKINYDKNTGESVYWYDSYGIVQDMVKVLEQKPEYLGILMRDVYTSLKYQKLREMEYMFKSLKYNVSQNENMASLSAELDKYSSFLGYALADCGLPKEVKTKYAEVVITCNSIGYDALPEEYKKIVKEITDTFSNELNDLSNQYINELRDLTSYNDIDMEKGMKL